MKNKLFILNRRDFIKSLFFISLASCSQVKKILTTYSPLSNSDRTLIISLQNFIFPIGAGFPDASSIFAIEYFEFIIITEPAESDFFSKNIPHFVNFIKNTYNKQFFELSNEMKQIVLQNYTSSAKGEKFISKMLTYIFECLLASPIYGGNPEESGWKWLEITPGQPQPNKTNTYQELIKKYV